MTAALINSLPLERAGAGLAVTNTVRPAGSVIGIAVGGTIMSIGAAVLVAALRPDTKPAGLVQEPAHDRNTPRTEAAPG
ncbi:hypothetical protein [Streptomyces sp. NPDC059761]|uniref:hypothetical protein n=1 Tax=Streptomyces sp. NPDC059761 TaxID=3346937 RepID=UPI00364FCAB6